MSKVRHPALAIAALLLLPGTTLFAQRAPRPRLQVPPVLRRVPGQNNNRLDPRWVDRLKGMTPEEQDKFLSNYARFQNLPPERQAEIRQRLQVWNSLSPEQRETLQQRERVLNQLTPDQQRYFRQTLLPQWRGMRPARRQAVLARLHDLRGLDDSQREARLNDENYLNGLSPDERQMLRDLSNLRVSP